MNRYNPLSQRAGAFALAAAALTLCVPVLAVPPARHATKAPSSEIKPMDLWYQLSANDQAIGWMHRTAALKSWHGAPAWRYTTDIDAFNPTTKVRAVEHNIDYGSQDGKSLQSSFSLTNPTGTVVATALYKGRYIDASLSAPLTGTQTQITQKYRVSLKPGVRLAPDISQEVPPRDLQEGKQLAYWNYDPLSRQVRKDVITVVGKTTVDLPGHEGAPAWEVSELQEGTANSDIVWVNSQGVVIKAQMSIPGLPDVIATLAPHHIAAKR